MRIFNEIQRRLGINAFDTIYKTLTFHDFWISLSPRFLKHSIHSIRKEQNRIVQRLRSKNNYIVVFFLQNDSIWKYDALYQLLEASPFFTPYVVVSPYNVHIVYDKQECFRVLKHTLAFAQEKGYRCLSTYDFETNTWVDIKAMLHPDIVFFTKPYKDTLPNYHLYHFRDTLTLYTSYGIPCVDIYRENFNLSFHNLLWKFLMETDIHQQIYSEHSLCQGENGVVVGCIGTETLMTHDHIVNDEWKKQSIRKKRVIWAPHHTVDYLFNFSNFLIYCDEMFRIANKYKDQIQIAFKPHPVLKFKLINIWGKEKTEAYYQRWTDLENGQIAEGSYMDLFLTSDALIHDCGSFTAEYLYTHKPVLFMVRDENVKKRWNPFGQQCLKQHYHATNIDQIEQFIQSVVINGNDTMKEQREQFFKDYLYPKDGVMPSQKIYNILEEALKK